MSDATTLDRPEARSAFAPAVGEFDNGSGRTSASPFTDFERKRYVELMANMRGRVMDMVGKVRDGELDIKKHDRELDYQFQKAAFSSALNLYGALRSPMKMMSWLLNIVETGVQMKNQMIGNHFAKVNFGRMQDGLLFTLRTAAHVDSMPKPTDAQGNEIFVEPVMMVPNPVTGSALDKAFVEKFVPKTLDGKFLRKEDGGKPFDLHRAIWGPNGP